MALLQNSMTSLFRAYDVAERAVDQGYMLSSYLGMKYSLKTYKNQHSSQISKLEEREYRMFNALNIKSGDIKKRRDILQERIAGYTKEADSLRIKDDSIASEVYNLYGFGLRQSFISPLKAENDDAKKLFQYLFDKYIPDAIDAIIETGIDERNFSLIIKEYLNEINKKEGKKGTFSARAIVGGKQNDTKDIIAYLLPKRQRERIKEILAKKIASDPNLKKDVEKLSGFDKNKGFVYSNIENAILKNGVDNFIGNKYTITYTIDNSWFGITEKETSSDFLKRKGYIQEKTTELTPRQIQQLYEDQELTEINNKIRNLIIKYNPSAQTDLLNKCVDKVLKEKPYAFLVGKSYTQVEGVLGEIQALYLLARVMGGTNSLDRLSWIGGMLNDDGQQPHVDIILDGILGESAGGFGIQVKNSTSDLLNQYGTGYIDFTSVKLETFLDRVGFEKWEKDIIMSVYATSEFNVEYKRDKDKTYKQFSNPEFAWIRAKLEDNVALANKLFDVFAATLMYMNAEEQTQKDKTLLYIVGGVLVETSSQILNGIYNQLYQGRFKVAHTYSKNPYTIVDYFNEHGRDNKVSGMKMAAAQIMLTSSFQFMPGQFFS